MPVRRVRKNEWINAVLYGTLTGLIGVALFVLVLQLASKAPNEETIPVQTQQQPPQEGGEALDVLEAKFFAIQHGLFSSLEAATIAINADPTLNKAAIVEVDGQFYVWSSLAIEKKLPITEPTAFFKPMTIGAACSVNTIQKIPLLLQDEKYLKNNFEQEKNKGEVPDDWGSLLQATAKLSSDIDVIRLHLLAHYYSANDCLKISF